MKRGTGACTLPVEGIPVTGASPEASGFEQTVCVMDRKLYPVGYASKKLNLTEATYPIIEKECLAVYGVSRG